MQIPCVILCGGKSSRMGRNKALLAFKNQTLLQYQFSKMSSLFQDVFISSKVPYFNLPALIEEDKTFSPLIGILNAFQQLKAKKIFFICVDTPFITKSNILSLINSLPSLSDIHFAKTPNKEHFLTSIWDINTMPLIQQALVHQEYKISKIFQKCITSFFTYNEEKNFYNLNTQEDYLSVLKGS
ncbi:MULTISPECIES: molybdenum cofactor guanylyltransferase MobA [unclassified Helicobacter]|uniref:molybdenum cofactor guanylyltransferase MobA n=1 Tax=unclassified Helicobacter TaxID=2593540 RepID=UPI000CF12D3F|nr:MULTISPECIES: molybdenum cofactor guanylyltransferase MobA [unclassified Helicobacter]